MLNRKFSRALTAGIFTAMPFIATEVSAGGKLDGSSDMVCAVMNVVACLDGSSCIEGSAKSFDLPELIILDTKKKVMRATYESGHKAVSPVKNLEHSGNHMILQGVENSRGWDIAIDTKTGTMSGSGVGEAVSFLVFGTCTAL